MEDGWTEMGIHGDFEEQLTYTRPHLLSPSAVFASSSEQVEQVNCPHGAVQGASTLERLVFGHLVKVIQDTGRNFPVPLQNVKVCSFLMKIWAGG